MFQQPLHAIQRFLVSMLEEVLVVKTFALVSTPYLLGICNEAVHKTFHISNRPEHV
jgi:hypothetical protein